MKDKITEALFRQKKWVIAFIGTVTVFLAIAAMQMRIDAGFEKQLPMKHPYVQTFVGYQDDFGTANRVMIAVSPKEGDIFTPEFLRVFKNISDEAHYITGANRSWIESLFTPNVRFVEVVDGGFSGGA